MSPLTIISIGVNILMVIILLILQYIFLISTVCDDRITKEEFKEYIIPFFWVIRFYKKARKFYE